MSDLKIVRETLRKNGYKLQSDYIFYDNFSIQIEDSGKLNLVSTQSVVSEKDLQKDFETLKGINSLLPYSFFSEHAETIKEWAKEKNIIVEFSKNFDLLCTAFFRLLLTDEGIRIEYNSKHISIHVALKEYDFIFQVLNLYKICQEI